MRFFKKIDMSKDTRKLGDEYMPNGSIRVLNPYEVQKPKSGESEPETCPTAIFKRIESRKITRRNEDTDYNTDANNEQEPKESETEDRNTEATATQLSLSPTSSPSPENERKEVDDESEQND